MGKRYPVEVDELFGAILSLQSIEECYMFFEDALTYKEILDIAQRLKAARLLRDKTSYVDVCRITGMSTATISRVSKALERGAGGYKLAMSRMDEKKESK